MQVIQKFFHKTLKIPHVLHVGFDKGKRKSPTIVFVHGLGRNNAIWRGVLGDIASSDVSARFVGIDLLGFGKSPKPEWQRYDAITQARSLHMTLKIRGVKGPVTIVGHSLGALVAVEYARLFPRDTKRIMLVSAPLYRSEPGLLLKKFPSPLFSERIYKSALRSLRTRQDIIPKLNLYLRKAKFFDKDFVVDDENLLGVVRSIEMAIENQSAYNHAADLDLPIDFVYGLLDPYIIKKYYRLLARDRENRTVRAAAGGHELTNSRRLEKAVSDLVIDYLKRD